MSNRFEQLINSGAWASLKGQTEKLLVAWFATMYPQKPLTALRDTPLLEATKGIGASKTVIVKDSIDNLLGNPTFRFCYEAYGKDSGNVSRKISRKDSSATKGERKGKEESSPHTPFKGEKGKREERSHNRTNTTKPTSQTQANVSSVDPLVSDAFKPVLQEIADSYVPGSEGVVTSGAATDAVVEEVTLKYPQEFEVFYAAYPNRWGLKGVGYLRLKAFWKQAEERGVMGPAMLKALETADATWKADRKEGKKVFIPNADKFLNDETYLRRYLPAMEMAKMLGAPIEDDSVVVLKNPQAFEEFCTLYPKKRGLLDPKEKVITAKAWKGCEDRDWYPHDIIRALKEAIVSARWTTEEGRYIPTAEKFLNEEQMRQFLPIGFNQKTGSSSHIKKPLTPEEAYWQDITNFI